jgi:hypothetical protein
MTRRPEPSRSGQARVYIGLMSNLATRLSTAAILADPQMLLREFQAGNTVYVPELDYTLVPTSNHQWIVEQIVEESDEAEDMASLRTDRTGVDNTIFVSTRGYGRHAPRIKIAVDPPDSLNAAGKNASMAISDYRIIGEYLPSHIAEQAKRFIEQNRETLLAYWNCEIATEEMIKRLKRPE